MSGEMGTRLTLYPDAEAAVFIIARFVGYNIANGKWNLGILNTSANANWTFVYIQERANTVSGTMPVIQPLRPQKLPRQTIKREAAYAFGKFDLVERDMSFQH